MIRTCSKDQEIRALSSAEAELYAACLGGCQAKGVRSIPADMGIVFEILMKIDASAAIGIIQRKGLGKVRHIEVKDLWLQDEVRERRIVIEKIPGVGNPADMGTKGLSRGDIDKHVQKLRCYYEQEPDMLYSILLSDPLPTLSTYGHQEAEDPSTVGGCKMYPMLPNCVTLPDSN